MAMLVIRLAFSGQTVGAAPKPGPDYDFFSLDIRE